MDWNSGWGKDIITPPKMSKEEKTKRILTCGAET